MCYVILFLLTAGVLRHWQADEPENMTGCSPAVIFICVCVCERERERERERFLFLMPPGVDAPRSGTLTLLLIQQFSWRRAWCLVSV